MSKVRNKKRREWTKCASAALLSTCLILSLAACGNSGGGKQQTDTTADVLSVEERTYTSLGTVVSLTTDTYVYARLLTDDFLAALESGAPRTTLEAKLAIAVEAWETVGAMCAMVEEIPDDADEVLSNSDNTQVSQRSAAQGSAATTRQAFCEPGFLGMKKAYAAAPDDETATEWAERITSEFDKTKGSQRLKQLATQLGTDTKGAYDQLCRAQETIRQGAMADAEWADTKMKIALGIKTTCKTGLFICATVATAGATTASAGYLTLTEGVGVVISGTSTVLEISATTSNIVLGEDHAVTLSAQDASNWASRADYVFSCGSLVTGGVSNLAKMVQKGTTDIKTLREAASDAGAVITFTGSNLIDWFSSGTLMGVNPSDFTGTKKIKIGDLLKNKDFTGAKDELAKEGITLPELTEKTTADLIVERAVDIKDMRLVAAVLTEAIKQEYKAAKDGDNADGMTTENAPESSTQGQNGSTADVGDPDLKGEAFLHGRWKSNLQSGEQSIWSFGIDGMLTQYADGELLSAAYYTYDGASLHIEGQGTYPLKKVDENRFTVTYTGLGVTFAYARIE